MEDLKKAEQQLHNKASHQPTHTKNNDFTGGLVMIAMGVVFLFVEYGNFHLDNWWALFILIPVLIAWSKAASLIKAAGGMTTEAIKTITGSFFPLFIAAIFLFGWDWGRIWPGFIILGGINALASSWGKNRE